MTTAVAWLWQGLAIAALAAILVRAMPRLNAATRHVIWWLALGFVLVQPWTLSWSAASPTTDIEIGRPGRSLRTGAAAGLRVPELHLPSPPDRLVFAALVLWGGGVCFNLWRIAAGVHRIVRLKHSSRAMAEARQDRLPLWSSQRDRGRRPELRVTDTETTPCALGLGRPVILIPAQMVSTLADADLDLIVMHEHAHLARYDDWFRVLQCSLVAVTGIHPAVRLIARHIDLEREAACDDRVVISTGDPRSYARCLATVAGLITRVAPAAAVAPHAVRAGSGLRSRVMRLIDHRPDRTERLARRATIASFATLLLAAFVSDCMPPFVVVDGVGVAMGDGAGGDRRADAPALSATPFTWMFTMVATMPSTASPARSDAVVRAQVVDRPVPETRETSPAAAGTEPRLDGIPGVPGATVLPEPIDSRVLTPALSVSPSGSGAGLPDSPALDGLGQPATLADRSVAAGQQVKRLGVSVGSSSRRAGTSVGRFFGRAGKSIAAGF